MRSLPHSLQFSLPLAVAALLAGCGRETTPDPAALERLRPSDARIAATYERSCLLCHGRPNSGAPASGDAKAWAPRRARGLDALVQSTRAGVGAMPAMGQCADCSDADLRALIDFMSEAK